MPRFSYESVVVRDPPKTIDETGHEEKKETPMKIYWYDPRGRRYAAVVIFSLSIPPIFRSRLFTRLVFSALVSRRFYLLVSIARWAFRPAWIDQPVNRRSRVIIVEVAVNLCSPHYCRFVSSSIEICAGACARRAWLRVRASRSLAALLGISSRTRVGSFCGKRKERESR